MWAGTGVLEDIAAETRIVTGNGTERETGTRLIATGAQAVAFGRCVQEQAHVASF